MGGNDITPVIKALNDRKVEFIPQADRPPRSEWRLTELAVSDVNFTHFPHFTKHRGHKGLPKVSALHCFIPEEGEENEILLCFKDVIVGVKE